MCRGHSRQPAIRGERDLAESRVGAVERAQPVDPPIARKQAGHEVEAVVGGSDHCDPPAMAAERDGLGGVRGDPGCQVDRRPALGRGDGPVADLVTRGVVKPRGPSPVGGQVAEDPAAGCICQLGQRSGVDVPTVQLGHARSGGRDESDPGCVDRSAGQEDRRGAESPCPLGLGRSGARWRRLLHLLPSVRVTDHDLRADRPLRRSPTCS